MIQGQYNARAWAELRTSKEAAWEYIKSIPVEYRAGCVSAVKMFLRRSK